MTELVGAAVQAAVAVTLVVAGAAKLAVPREIVATLTALRSPAVPVVRVVLPLGEIGLAVAVATAPTSPATAAAVCALGAAFALVGLSVHLRGDAVACACFGGRQGRRLGLRQVAVLPAWIAAAVLPWVLGSPVSGADGLLALVVVVVGACGAAAVPVVRLGRQNAGYMAVAQQTARRTAEAH